MVLGVGIQHLWCSLWKIGWKQHCCNHSWNLILENMYEGEVGLQTNVWRSETCETCWFQGIYSDIAPLWLLQSLRLAPALPYCGQVFAVDFCWTFAALRTQFLIFTGCLEEYRFLLMFLAVRCGRMSFDVELCCSLWFVVGTGWFLVVVVTVVIVATVCC